MKTAVDCLRWTKGYMRRPEVYRCVDVRYITTGMRSLRFYKLILLALLGVGCFAEEEPEAVHLGPCIGPTGHVDFVMDPTVRESVEGTNGLFVESCDNFGNLKTFSCNMHDICDSENMCEPFPTGEVGTWSLYCAGQCMAGTCPE